MFRRVSVMATTLPLMLGACATYYPPLYSSPAIADQPIAKNSTTLAGYCRGDSDAVLQTVSCAEILQAVYSSGYTESAKLQDYSQLPIIGAAAAAAWILLKDKEKAAKKVGKIGIGALAYGEARDQLFPKGMSEIYIKGHAALGCVIVEKAYFSGGPAKDALKSLDQSLVNTAALSVKASQLRLEIPADKDAAPELLTAARAFAEQAITAANTQVRASRQQRAAYIFAPSTFQQAVTDVAAWVASKGRARPNKSYDDLKNAMPSSPKTEGPDATKPTDDARALLDLPVGKPKQRTTAEILNDLGLVTQGLTEATLALQGNTPPYTGRLEKIANCATDLSEGT